MSYEASLEGGQPNVTTQWHQLKHLLTIYYFSLKRWFPGKVIDRNSVGYGRHLHSGLRLDKYMPNPNEPTAEGLEELQKDLRLKFEAITKALSQGLLTEPLNLG